MMSPNAKTVIAGVALERQTMRLTITILLLSLASPKLNAQELPNLKGHTVRIHSTINDISFTGRVFNQNRDSIFIMGRYGEAVYQAPWRSVNKLEVRVPSKTRGRNALQGAIIGAIVGLIPVFAIGPATCSDCNQSRFDVLVPLAGVDLGFAALGAAIGALASRGSWEIQPLPIRDHQQ